MEETIIKEAEKVEKVVEKPKVRLKTKLYFWLESKLKKYDLLDKKEESLDYWFMDHLKKPFVSWIIEIFTTSVLIFIVAISIMGYSLNMITMSIGIAITWFLVIEFVKDLKRVK